MALTNGTPRIIFGGINDKSRGTLVRGEITYAQHTPLLRLFTETGPTETTYVGNDSDSFNSLYGGQTLARRSKYYNLQSMLAEKLLGEGNGFYVKRLIPDDAPNPARIVVALELVPDQIDATIETLAGFNYTAETSAANTLGKAATSVAGYRARIVTIPDNTSELGKQEVVPGALMAKSDGSQSTLYPLFELPASFVGGPGNQLGIRCWAPTLEDNIGFDETTADTFKTRMYRFQFLKKYTGTTTPSVVLTAADEDYVDVCFTEGAYSDSTDKDYYIGSVLTQAYEDDGIESGLAPLYSPFKEIYVYDDNIATVQKILFDKEVELNPATKNYMTEAGQYDFLTMTGVDGDAYQGVVLEGALGGGILLGKDTVVYAQGGGDGTMNHATYESLVTKENLVFGKLGDQYENVAIYQFGHIYDTGLSMEGKYAMMNVLAARKDIKAIFTTYVEAEGKMPTASEELSRAASLMTRLKAFPESTLHGTPVCRAEIIQQSGKLMGGGYAKPVPQVIDYAVRWAQFGGAGTGILREGKDIDESPNNRVTEIKALNVPYFGERSQSAAWESGATYTLSYDTRSNFYPCIRSVYNDETSVLLSPITVNICCDIMRMIHKVHADFSGNAKLTNEQFVERCDKRIMQLVGAKYNNRVDVVPQTYFTIDDQANRFSWHCRVKVLASNPRTVMYFDLETHNRDLQQAAA